MNIQKIIRILSVAVGILGIIFLIRIIGAGDEELKAAAETGDTAFVDGYLNPISYLSWIPIRNLALVSSIGLPSLYPNGSAWPV